MKYFYILLGILIFIGVALSGIVILEFAVIIQKFIEMKKSDKKKRQENDL